MDSKEEDVCGICLEDLTGEHGKVITSCKHTYHFLCLSTWFYKEVQTSDMPDEIKEYPGSCPSCRKKLNKMEDLPWNVDLDSESDDTEMDDDSESYTSDISESEFLNESMYINLNRLNLRITFSVEDESYREIIVDITRDPDTVATKIQALWRGYRERTKYFNRLIARILIQMYNG